MMASSPLNENSANAKNEEFNHQLAIKLSRALNIVNPNDLLAKRVSDLAKQHDVDGFRKGIIACCTVQYVS